MVRTPFRSFRKEKLNRQGFSGHPIIACIACWVTLGVVCYVISLPGVLPNLLNSAWWLSESWTGMATCSFCCARPLDLDPTSMWLSPDIIKHCLGKGYNFLEDSPSVFILLRFFLPTKTIPEDPLLHKTGPAESFGDLRISLASRWPGDSHDQLQRAKTLSFLRLGTRLGALRDVLELKSSAVQSFQGFWRPMSPHPQCVVFFSSLDWHRCCRSNLAVCIIPVALRNWMSN